MYERKFNADDVRPEGDNGRTVYTVTKPIECRFGTFKEGSKVILEVNGLCCHDASKIAFDVIGVGEKDIILKDTFVLEVLPDSVKWLNEHLEKDEELSRRNFLAAQAELDADAAEGKLEDKVIQFAGVTFLGSLCVAMVVFVLTLFLNFSADTILKIAIPLSAVGLSGVFAFLWYTFIRENKYLVSERAYRKERDNILRGNG